MIMASCIPESRNLGTNGTAQIALGCSGSLLLELFNQLNRGTDPDQIVKVLQTIIEQARQRRKPAASSEADESAASAASAADAGSAGEAASDLVDLFVLAFQTRDCRGGKGERKLFCVLFLELYKHFPAVAICLLHLVAEYGYFKDYQVLYESIATKDDALEYAKLSEALVDTVAGFLEADKGIMEAAEKSKVACTGLSLAAKYAPRVLKCKRNPAQKRQKNAFARSLRNKLFTDSSGVCPADAWRQYRKLLSKLNTCLETVECKMSNHQWGSVQADRIPSLCLKRCRNAFLNEDKRGNIRRPHDKARMELRQRLLDSAGTKQLKGGQLHAHEIVQQCMKHASAEAAKILDAQWRAMIQTLQQQLDSFGLQQQEAAGAAGAAAKTKSTFSLGKLVALVDVSGSMAGLPMQVAIAMGLVVSELTMPSFRNRVLTFETQPQWHQILGDNIVSRVRNLRDARWGGSTNFAAAVQRVFDAVESVAMTTKQMPVVPDLIVFSDMQFDVANGGSSWDTAYESICTNFAALVQRLRAANVENLPDDSVVQPCTITFWNLNSRTTGLVASADTKGVRMLSGFSQSLLKLVLTGALPDCATDAADAADAAGQASASDVDPMITLRAALDDERYNLVRSQLEDNKLLLW